MGNEEVVILQRCTEEATLGRGVLARFALAKRLRRTLKVGCCGRVEGALL